MIDLALGQNDRPDTGSLGSVKWEQ